MYFYLIFMSNYYGKKILLKNTQDSRTREDGKIEKILQKILSAQRTKMQTFICRYF